MFFKTSSSLIIGLFLVIELVYDQGGKCNAQLPRRLAETKCYEYQDYVYEKIPVVSLVAGGSRREIKIEKCGISSIKLILGGKDAEPMEFPHMALIGYKSKSSNEVAWGCGGSLISENFVLTAAHCKQSSSDPPRLVRLGDLNIKSDTDDARPEDYIIQKFLSHPKYEKRTKKNDIALIQLADLVKFDSFKRPACLSTTPDWPEKEAWATGWGYNNTDDKIGTNHLQKVKLEKFSEGLCKSKYVYPITYERQVCLGSNTTAIDTCQGDSGGPIQIIHKSVHCMWEIVGVTSYGHTCGSIGVPGVYVRVYPYIDWIEENVWS